MDPYKVDDPFSISFSGGQSSGFMLRKVLDAWGGEIPSHGKVVFANTGLEHPKTLKFVRDVSERWGVDITWLEYCPEDRFKVVRPEHASLDGGPFKSLIHKKGYLPTPVSRVCSSNLKMRAISSFLLSEGWHEWVALIGLRYDEPRRAARIKGDIAAEHPVCPMYEAKHTLQDVEDFWGNQEFDLEIPRFMGNCVGCFLKSRGRLEMIAEHEPDSLQWWADIEQEMESTFRIDRPSYSGLLHQVSIQGRLFDDDGTTQSCRCSD